MKKSAGWTFSSSLTIQGIQLTLNRAIPMLGSHWKWRLHESDSKGTYLVSRPKSDPAEVFLERALAQNRPDGDPNLLLVRIIEHKKIFWLDIRFWSSKPDQEAEKEFSGFVKTIHETILPLIDAESITEAGYYD